MCRLPQPALRVAAAEGRGTPPTHTLILQVYDGCGTKIGKDLACYCVPLKREQRSSDSPALHANAWVLRVLVDIKETRFIDALVNAGLSK